MSIGGDGLFVLMSFLPIIVMLALIIFIIYFVIKIIKFMNAKTKADQIRNEKMDQLINMLRR